jgi:hypothetical protein
MVKKPRGPRRRPDGNGRLELTTLAFTEAYRDATYAVMLKTVERILEDPKRRADIERLTIRLLESILEGLREGQQSVNLK